MNNENDLVTQAAKTNSIICLVGETIINFSDDGLKDLSNDYLTDLVKNLGEYQDYCHKMAGMAETAMVRIESIVNNRVGGV